MKALIINVGNNYSRAVKSIEHIVPDLVYIIYNEGYEKYIYKKLDINERKEMIDLILKLQDRIIPMCQKYDIPIATEMKRRDYCMFDLPLFLAMLDKFDVNSEEGLITQMARVYAPHLLEDNPNWDYRN